MRKHASSERWQEVGRCLNVCDLNFLWFIQYLNENTSEIMSEQKRVSFSTLGPIRKEKNKERTVKSVRIILTLAESNEKSCPEFNYRELVAQKLVSNSIIVSQILKLKFLIQFYM